MTSLTGQGISAGRSGISGDVDRALSISLDLETRLLEILHKLGLPQQPSNEASAKDTPVPSLVSSVAALNGVLGRNQVLVSTILKGL